MKKKKFLVLLLTFIMVFALAACGSSDDDDDDDDRKSRTEKNDDDDEDDDDEDEKKSSKKDKAEDEDEDEKKSSKDEDDEDDVKPSKEKEEDKDEKKPAKKSESLDGTWYYCFDASEMLDDELGTEGSYFVIDIYFAFDEDDKTMEMYADTDRLSSQLYDIMVEYMYQNFEDQMGYSRDEADAYCMENLGYDIAGYIETMMPYFDDAFGDFSMSGTYETDGNKLYVTEYGETLDEDNYILFEVNGDELTLDDPSGSDEIEGLPLPMILERID